MTKLFFPKTTFSIVGAAALGGLALDQHRAFLVQRQGALFQQLRRIPSASPEADQLREQLSVLDQRLSAIPDVRAWLGDGPLDFLLTLYKLTGLGFQWALPIALLVVSVPLVFWFFFLRTVYRARREQQTQTALIQEVRNQQQILAKLQGGGTLATVDVSGSPVSVSSPVSVPSGSAAAVFWFRHGIFLGLALANGAALIYILASPVLAVELPGLANQSLAVWALVVAYGLGLFVSFHGVRLLAGFSRWLSVPLLGFSSLVSGGLLLLSYRLHQLLTSGLDSVSLRWFTLRRLWTPEERLNFLLDLAETSSSGFRASPDQLRQLVDQETSRTGLRLAWNSLEQSWLEAQVQPPLSPVPASATVILETSSSPGLSPWLVLGGLGLVLAIGALAYYGLWTYTERNLSRQAESLDAVNRQLARVTDQIFVQPGNLPDTVRTVAELAHHAKAMRGLSGLSSAEVLDHISTVFDTHVSRLEALENSMASVLNELPVLLPLPELFQRLTKQVDLVSQLSVAQDMAIKTLQNDFRHLDSTGVTSLTGDTVATLTFLAGAGRRLGSTSSVPGLSSLD